MGSGSHKFRVAFVLKEVRGEYHNIDDGIYAEPMTITSEGQSLKGQTAGGGSLELSLSQDGKSMTGTFRQGPGTDFRSSLVGQEESYPVTLQSGRDYLEPRLSAEGAYRYEPPRELTDGWEIADFRKAKGDLPRLEAVVQDILDSKYPYVHSLTVVKGGKLALDEYFYGYKPADTHPVQSVTKSIFSLLFGIAQDQKLCDTGQGLFNFFPEYRQKPGWDPRKEAITLQNLLTMTSGLGCDDLKDSLNCSWGMVNSPDWLSFSLSLPLVRTPGSHFTYCGACLMPLGIVLEKRSGMKLPDFAQKFLFDPLGIQVLPWWEGPGGVHSPAFGLALRPRDLAKLGLLVLQKGKWNGQQVVPEDWIHQSTSPQVTRTKTGKDADYGYLWWERNIPWNGKNLRVLDAWGVGGQHIFIAPQLDLVCVVTGGNYKNSALANKSFKIFRKVLDCFP